MTTTDAVLDRLLDAERLSGLLGRDVRAASVRAKPGALVVLGLAEATTGRPTGWVRVLWPELRVKATKVAERAARRGQELTELALGELHLQSGRIGTDPALASVVRDVARRRVRALVDDPAAVLRHNPLRRVLVRDGDTVVRVTAEPDALGHALLAHLAAAGLPVPARLDDGSRPQLAVRPFFGDTDLARTPTRDGMAWAGRTLARLHAEGPAVLRAPALAGLADRTAGGEPLRLAADLARLDPDLGRRAARLAGRLAGRPALGGEPTLVHGDASADQVLLDRGTGRLQLNDFDRAGVGPAVLDLGSWLAVGPRDAGLDEALLDGYVDGGGLAPSASDLDTARALGLFARVMAPLREAEPTWRAGVAARLDALEEVLA